ncbi:SseB family protein [Leucobacter allii]|uniref:SseB family protein n=1 Tax=Leucobacter allii TaxID=2932247 RepID=A0ABY4FPS9_9MICO|nr:SseB family protein [Leucobacter allii]UOQ58251.1 SseB family protein [Leucobacter allii]
MAIKKLPSTGDAPRATGVPESLVPGGAADSAGFPWEGRTFDHHGTAFAGDDGSGPAAVVDAVAEVRAAAALTAGARTAGDYWDAVVRLAGAHAAVIAALGRERVLVPMLADAGALGTTPDGRTVEKSQELSIVTVAAPDGRRVLPVFSSTAALGNWHAEARPIPVPGVQAAVAAAQERTDLLMLDAADAEREFGIRRPALRALALGERYLPAWADPEVEDAFDASAADEREVSAVWLAPADPESRLRLPDVDVRLRVVPGLDPDGLRALLGRLQERWAGSAVIADRVDSMRVRPVAER